MSYSRSIQSAITNTPQNRFYEGGKRTQQNRDFYNANSEFENTATPDRDTMRARSRWLHENNPIMANIDDSIINNVIGKGIIPQPKTGIKKTDDAISKRWLYFVKNCNIDQSSKFYQDQKMVLENRMVDGEIFIYKMKTRDGLKLQYLEADALDTSKGNNGITYNENGAASSYHFRHGFESRTISADKIINYFKKVRPTQKRGISEYKQAIIDIKNFSAFQSATIQAARARANIAYAVESDRDPDAFGKTRDTSNYIDGDIVDVNGLMVYYLRSGEDLKALDSSNGGANYKEFVKSCVRLMAVARKISYELAFRDYSEVNFSSARASLIQDNKGFDDDREHIIDNFLEDIYETWLELEIDLGNIKGISRNAYLKNEDKYKKHTWSFPKREWVDPVKDLAAIKLEVSMNLTTISDACTARGGDYQDNLMTLAKEIEMKKEILGEHYDEVIAMEQSNNSLLEALLLGDEEIKKEVNNENKN